MDGAYLKKMLSRRFFWLLLMFGLTTFAGAAPKKGVAPASKAEPVADLARRLRPSVVVVSHYGRDGKQDGVGAGFVISPDGLVATCAHVIGCRSHRRSRPRWRRCCARTS